ncbi:MAG: hypothetical protein AAF726_17525 [Planctomycetota bacterium]
MSDRPASLDDAATEAAAEIASSGIAGPDALLFLATGAGAVPEAMDDRAVLPLRDVPGVPRAWHAGELCVGRIGETIVWIVEDAPESAAPGEPAWHAGFPVWLAAAAGTRLLVHASAGTSLARPGDAPFDVGRIVRVTDHVNLSGRSPLTGMGESRLGPLFPDQSRLHDAELAEVAHEAASAVGAELAEGVAACTTGPALSTPAEHRWFASAGGDVAVQRLADPLVAAAHAGLSALSLVAVSDLAGEEDLDVATLVARAARTAPTLDRLLTETAQRLAPVARARAEEEVT